MIDAIATNNSTTSGLVSYASSWAHLADELKRLDLRIRLQLLGQRANHPPNPLDQFRGLVLSESEVSGLLTDEPDKLVDEVSATSTTREYQALVAALTQIDSEIESRLGANAEEGIYLSLPHLAHLFQLTAFERECLVICLAPELDRKYEKLYAYLQDDVTRKKPSVSLVMNLLLNTMEERLAARSVFDAQAPLLRFRLLQMYNDSPEQSTPLLARFLKLDDRIVNFLLETVSDLLRARGARLVWPQTPGNEISEEPELRLRVKGFINAHLRDTAQDILFYLGGPDEGAKQLLAESVAADRGRSLLVGDAGKMLSGSLPFGEAAWLLTREALLSSALLAVERVDLLFGDDDKVSWLSELLEAARTFSRVTFLFGQQLWKPVPLTPSTAFVKLGFPIPTAQARKQAWADSLRNDQEIADDLELTSLASKFRFTTRQIEQSVNEARNLANWRAPEDGRLAQPDIYVACRAQSHHQLNTLARKIEPVYTWADIVLPGDTLSQLRDLCSRVSQGQLVLYEWGFARKLSLGKGVNALFAGSSGTGKTMAAEIIANELGLELYKIDLSGIVSKYIGETEKNLDRVFTTAENANVILFFDEADALFGKRSEVRDSHDRYANIEISYLLQKMEQYEGVAILATNMRQNLDDAFLRRLQFIVEFPFPDEFHRHQIWQVLFPPEAPRDEEIDFEALARQIRLAGGNIKNIALGAAYLAASDGGRINRNHLRQAATREYQKLGKVFT